MSTATITSHRNVDTARGTVRLTAAEVRLASQALAFRYSRNATGTADSAQRLLELLHQFTSPSAQADGLVWCVMGNHARTLRLAVADYDEAVDVIPAGWRAASLDLWHVLINARSACRRAGLDD